jgi:hypothetical protein
VGAARRALAETIDPPWVDMVAEAWPAPMAHEYWRFREGLRSGTVASALWQFKDVAEIPGRVVICIDSPRSTIRPRLETN